VLGALESGTVVPIARSEGATKCGARAARACAAGSPNTWLTFRALTPV